MGEIVTAVSDAGLGVIQLVELQSRSASGKRQAGSVERTASNTVIGLARRFVDHEK